MTTDKETSVAVVNHCKISIVTNPQGEQLVPVRPICQALGIDIASQRKRIYRDKIMSSAIEVVRAACTDGKRYKMICLPLYFLPGWLFTIDVSKVAKPKRDTMEQQRWHIYKIFYPYFSNTTNRIHIFRQVQCLHRKMVNK